MANNGISPLISDGMIIQRDVPFPIYSGSKVTVTFLDKTYESQNINGKWLLTLDPAQAGGPFTMDISGEDGTEFSGMFTIYTFPLPVVEKLILGPRPLAAFRYRNWLAVRDKSVSISDDVSVVYTICLPGLV
jgi:hypothetical protein